MNHSMATHISHHFDGFSRSAEFSQTHRQPSLYIHHHVRVPPYKTRKPG